MTVPDRTELDELYRRLRQATNAGDDTAAELLAIRIAELEPEPTGDFPLARWGVDA